MKFIKNNKGFCSFVIICCFIVLEVAYIVKSEPIVLSEYTITGTIENINMYGGGYYSRPQIRIVIKSDSGKICTYTKPYNRYDNTFDKKQYNILRSIYEGQTCKITVYRAMSKTMIFNKLLPFTQEDYFVYLE